MFEFILHPSRLYISIWFLLNIALTLLNKSVMEFNNFRFPITISFIHQAISTFCTYICAVCFRYHPESEKEKKSMIIPNYERKVMTRILMLSLLFTLNIIFGNSSLRYCSVAFVQIVRAIIPLITMILSVIFLRDKYAPTLYVSCFVICIGVALSCFGEINLTRYGFFVTIFGCFLSSAKSISVKKTLTGKYELHSFSLLERMSPISSIEMFSLILITGENQKILTSEKYTVSTVGILLVLLTGLIAFFWNLTNFLSTYYTSPLTVTIVGCLKQIITIVLSVIIFDKKLTKLNVVGIVVTMFGSLWYGILKLNNRKPQNDSQKIALFNEEEEEI